MSLSPARSPSQGKTPASTGPRTVLKDVPYVVLDCAKPMSLITPKERLYAHYMSQAAWYGYGITAAQVSEESPALLRFVFKVFESNTIKEVRNVVNFPEKDSSVTPEAVEQFIEYAALLYSNAGNYLSFGDSKFVPGLSREALLGIVAALPHNPKTALSLLTPQLLEAMYSTVPSKLSLAFPPKGTTSYYDPTIKEEDVAVIDTFLTEYLKLSQYNTRIFTVEPEKLWEVCIASVEQRKEEYVVCRETKKALDLKHIGAPGTMRVRLVYGDYSTLMRRVVSALQSAREYAANDIQKRMLDHYIASFTTGSIDEHKQSQREWVQDKGPIVETNLGFIENYRDPAGVRGEWEGLVALVDKDQSIKYGNMVQRGADFIARLPWGKDFERDTFRHPDFTSLEVLTMSGSGIPLGINIPNYDDVRSEVGFKNVYLGNVGGAINMNEKPNHLADADWELYKKHFPTALSVNVGIHELLGHGTGKLLTENEDGTFNFDKDSLRNPFSKDGKITSWYKPGETYSSKFGGFSNAMEECRAEAVGLYLALEKDLLAIFGQESQKDCDDTIHVVWLHMCRSGLVGLEMYTPATQQWRQAHCRARFCILQTLLRAPRSIVNIHHDPTEDKLEITLDASRIATDGKAAIGELLRRLNIYKAMGDAANGIAYFEDLTEVNEEFVQIRETVMKLCKPRRQFVQQHTRLNKHKDDVEVVNFTPNKEGAIAAMVARHKDVPFF